MFIYALKASGSNHFDHFFDVAISAEYTFNEIMLVEDILIYFLKSVIVVLHISETQSCVF